ncbi:MAG: acyl transferase [Bacteroidia bacterium]|nr:acyl transferase [Bacteroidia bacterium]
MINFFKQKIFNSDFDKLALEIFNFQSKNNKIYSSYLNFLGIKPQRVNDISKIPFLPIEFYKNHIVSSANNINYIKVFESSSTSGIGISSHYVYDLSFYFKTAQNCFTNFYGDIKNFTFRFLLPSYIERGNSSLIYMANDFLKISGKGSFYQKNFDKLYNDLNDDLKKGNRVVLLGVSFALLDFAKKYNFDLSKIIIMETGGMKGRRKEITRQELHDFLKKQFNTEKVHSEYGMTEIFSQAYSKGDGIYNCVPWMKVITTEPGDPFALQKIGKTGRINIIDLANIYTCCFLSTSDIGRVYDDNSFEVLGRIDNSDIRGCSLFFE